MRLAAKLQFVYEKPNRLLLRLRQRPRVRWLARLIHRHAPGFLLVLIAAPVAALLILDIAMRRVGHPVDHWAGRHEVGAALLEHGLVAVAVAAVAVYWVLGRKRQKALRDYRRSARKDPADFVEWSRGETPIVRLGTCRSLADAIKRSGTKPAVAVIQGRPGTGRTSCVVGLVKELAEHRMIPIPVLAKRDGSFDVEDLARAKFCKHVDRVVSSGEQADAIWHRARSSRDIVVLVDGVDDEIIRKLSGDRGKRFQKTIEQLRSSEIAVVLATTGDLPLGDITPVREDLDLFNREEVHAYLHNTLEKDADSEAAWTEDRVAAWTALKTLQEPIDGFLVAPFYVDLIVRLRKALISLTDLPQQTDRWRAEVLERYLDAVRNGKIELAGADDEERKERSCSAMQAAEEVAEKLKIGEADRLSVARISVDADELALSDAEDLNLLWRGDESVGFASEDLGAYLVAKRRKDPEQLLSDVRVVVKSAKPQKRRDRYVRSELIFWHLRHENVREATFEKFLDELDSCWTRPLLVVAAVRIVCACELTDYAERVADTAEKCIEWLDTPENRKAQPWRAHELRGLVRALAAWPYPQAHRLLWSLATSQNLEIEWWAARALAMSEGDPAGTLNQEFGDVLSAAEQVLLAAERDPERNEITKPNDDTGQKIASLAWILPALRDAQSSLEPEFFQRLQNVCISPWISPLRGQMALAQGLKLAILKGGTVPENAKLVRELLRELVRSEHRFWHAQLVLVQALLAHAWEHREHADSIRKELDAVPSREVHPFVRDGIELARRGLLELKRAPDGRSSTLNKYMWSHEREAVRWVELGNDDLARLAADVVLLSNMNYRLWEKDLKKADEAAAITKLPPCIQKSSRRKGIDRECECGRELCQAVPDHAQAVPDEAQAVPIHAVLAGRARFSASFCRDQARLIGQNGSPPWIRRRPRRKKRLEDFWHKQANLVQKDSTSA